MANLGKTIQTQVKKSGQQTAQSIARQARTQTLETLKTARAQVGLPTEKLPAQPSVYPSTVRTLQNQGPSALNPDEIKRRETELLSQWRGRLREIQEEEALARRERQEQYQAWKRAQEEAIHPAGTDQAEPLVVPAGKPKKGFLAGAKAAIKQKLSTPETGRGAKH